MSVHLQKHLRQEKKAALCMINVAVAGCNSFLLLGSHLLNKESTLSLSLPFSEQYNTKSIVIFMLHPGWMDAEIIILMCKKKMKDELKQSNKDR